MENRTKDLGRERVSQGLGNGPGAQPAVASRSLERPGIRHDWDDCEAQAASDASCERSPDDASLCAADKAPLVLIVEDEETIAEALRLVVEDIGCRVALAPNGAAALAIARHETPALVLTDLMMPVMDGRTFIARLQQEAARGAMATTPPVVVMTAAGRIHARDLAVEDVLHKPFDLDEVEAKVEQFVGGRLRRSA